MKANRINLCTLLRESLYAAGYSTVAAVNAVNGSLEKLAVERTKGETTGLGKISKKGYRVGINLGQAKAFCSSEELNVPLVLDAYNTTLIAIEKLGIHYAAPLPVPPVFAEWLDGFAKREAAPAPQDNPPTPEPTPEVPPVKASKASKVAA